MGFPWQIPIKSLQETMMISRRRKYFTRGKFEIREVPNSEHLKLKNKRREKKKVSFVL